MDDEITDRRTTSVTSSSSKSRWPSRKRSPSMNSIWFFPWRMRRVLLRKLIEDPVKYTKHRTDQEYKNLWQFTKISIDILIILTRTIAHSPEWQLKIKWLQTSTDSKLKFKSYLYRETISSWIDAIQLNDNGFFREVVKKVENIFSKKKLNASFKNFTIIFMLDSASLKISNRSLIFPWFDIRRSVGEWNYRCLQFFFIDIMTRFLQMRYIEVKLR